MRLTPFLPVFLLVCIPLRAQSSSATTPATQDPQAVSILNQAVAVAGGLTAIAAITDYTGTGTITYHGDQDIQANVTVQGLGLDEFRLDADLPTGRRSSGFRNGQSALKAEDGTIAKFPHDHQVPSSDVSRIKPQYFPAALPFRIRS